MMTKVLTAAGLFLERLRLMLGVLDRRSKIPYEALKFEAGQEATQNAG
jgi:hypothetical protein